MNRAIADSANSTPKGFTRKGVTVLEFPPEHRASLPPPEEGKRIVSAFQEPTDLVDKPPIAALGSHYLPN